KVFVCFPFSDHFQGKSRPPLPLVSSPVSCPQVTKSEETQFVAFKKVWGLGAFFYCPSADFKPRVTNAQIQCPRALVEYMIQYWNLENRVTGRELGPERFFFAFGDEVTTVHLEYEKLEKHCFFCFSLSHEEKACPLKTSSGSKEDRPSGVKQDRDSHLIVEDKRRHEEKKTHWPHIREEAPRGVCRDYKRGYGEGGRSETRESNNHLSDYSNRIRDSHRYINTREKSSKDNRRSPPRSTRRVSVRSESDSHFQRSHQPCRTSFNEGNHTFSHNAAYVRRSHCLSSTRDM
ncbi:predicted protein, partial [Arabidopsis lyrata subsp. lyrata]